MSIFSNRNETSNNTLSTFQYINNIQESRSIMQNISETLLIQERNIRMLMLENTTSFSNNVNNQTRLSSLFNQSGGFNINNRTTNRPSDNRTNTTRRSGRNSSRRESDNGSRSASNSAFFQNIFRDLLNPNINDSIMHFDFLSPIVVRPTESQINNATQEITFSEIVNPLNICCPITQNSFNPDDNILQIRHCGHNFTPSNLREWFTRSVHCPVCRYDIRTYIDPSGGSIDPSGGSIDPSGSSVDPSGGSIDPSGGSIDPSGGSVDPSGVLYSGEVTNERLDQVARLIAREIDNNNNNGMESNIVVEYRYLNGNNNDNDNNSNGNNNGNNYPS